MTYLKALKALKMKVSVFLIFFMANFLAQSGVAVCGDFFSKESPENPTLQKLRAVSFQKIAPLITKAADKFLLRGAGLNPQGKRRYVFIARDGIGGYIAAQALLKRFPERYSGICSSDLQYLHLNKYVLNGDGATLTSYLQQAGLKPGARAYFFDLGWLGSARGFLKHTVSSMGVEFEGLNLVFAMKSSYPKEETFLNVDGRFPFTSLSGNKAIHFLEDTFSGLRYQVRKLTVQENGSVVPIFNGEYESQQRKMRQTALTAIDEYANKVDLADLDDLSSISQSIDRFFDFIANYESYRDIMVTHESH